MRIKRKLEQNEKKRENPALTVGKKKFLDFCCSCVKVILALLLAILTITSMLVTCSVDWDEVVSYAPDRIYKHILFAVVMSVVLVLCRHIRNLLRGNWLEKVFRDLTVNLDFNKVVIALHFVLGIFWVIATQVQTDVCGL